MKKEKYIDRTSKIVNKLRKCRPLKPEELKYYKNFNKGYWQGLI